MTFTRPPRPCGVSRFPSDSPALPPTRPAHQVPRLRSWLREVTWTSLWTAIRTRNWVRMPWPLELLVCVLGNALYEAVRAMAQASPSAAFAHAREIEAMEPEAIRALERGLNGWLSEHSMLATSAGYYYTCLHLTVAIVLLIWLWLRWPLVYARARTVLFAMTVGALAVFWAFPVAPPRLSVPGAVDTLVQQHIFGAQGGSTGHGLVNLYAAMPSLHVAWACWVAWAISATTRSRWRLLTWCYPVLTTMVVLATANHYLLDAVAGAVTLVLVIILVPQPGTAARATQSARQPSRQAA